MNELAIEKVERVVLLGGGAEIVSIAKFVIAQGKAVQIITSPRHAVEVFDPAGTIEECAKEANIPFLVAEDIASSQAMAAIGDMKGAVALSLGAAWIFKPQMIADVFLNRLFNLHGTRLPQNRGGGCWSWQILMGNRFGFSLLHVIDGGVDTGDIVAFREFLYPAFCRTPADYMAYYAEQNFGFVSEFLQRAFSGTTAVPLKGQPEYLSTHWPRLNTNIHGWIDWSWRAEQLDRFICAFDEPYAGAQTLWNGEPIRVKSVLADYADINCHPAQSGIVFRKNQNWLVVACNGGNIIVQCVLNSAGKDILDRVRVGDRFSTPQAMLEQRSERVMYTPIGLKANSHLISAKEI